VAHGRTTELDWPALRSFRTGLLETLDGQPPGLLRLLLEAQRPG